MNKAEKRIAHILQRASAQEFRDMAEETRHIPGGYGHIGDALDSVAFALEPDHKGKHWCSTLGTTPKPGEPELHLLLILSTTHLSKSANQALQDVTANDSRDAGPGCYLDEYKYGYHLTLTMDDSGGEWCDDCVKDIVTYAISIGATHVRLDADGPVVSALPTY